MFICPYVCNAKLEKLDHEFYLIFSVKLGDHKRRKVTQPDFLGKVSKLGGAVGLSEKKKCFFYCFFLRIE